jgi:hypothetical protein
MQRGDRRPRKAKTEEKGSHEATSGSSSASVSGSSRNTPTQNAALQFTIPHNMNEDQQAAFLFDVLADTQAAIDTVN